MHYVDEYRRALAMREKSRRAAGRYAIARLEAGQPLASPVMGWPLFDAIMFSGVSHARKMAAIRTANERKSETP